MAAAPYTPLPFGKYYYQELNKDYELWPSYNSSNNPHKTVMPFCPFFWYWMAQICCFYYLTNNPGNEFDEDMYMKPTVFGLPKIPGAPQVPGISTLPYIIQ